MDGLFRKVDDYYYITKCESGEYLIVGNDETKTATEEQVKNNFRKVEQSSVNYDRDSVAGIFVANACWRFSHKI